MGILYVGGGALQLHARPVQRHSPSQAHPPPSPSSPRQGLVQGLANGTVTSPDQLSPALDQVLDGLLTSPAGNQLAGFLSDVLDKLGQFLNSPISVPIGGGGKKREDGGSGDLGQAVSDIISGIVGSLEQSGGVLGSEAGKGDGPGGQGGIGGGAGDVVSGIMGAVDSLLGAFTGGSLGGGDASRGGNATTPGNLLNQLVGAVAGALGKDPQGVDITALLPVFEAVVADPNAHKELPGGWAQGRLQLGWAGRAARGGGQRVAPRCLKACSLPTPCLCPHTPCRPDADDCGQRRQRHAAEPGPHHWRGAREQGGGGQLALPAGPGRQAGAAAARRRRLQLGAPHRALVISVLLVCPISNARPMPFSCGAEQALLHSFDCQTNVWAI